MKILIIEDNQLNRKLIAEMLSTAGHETLEAPDAAIGIDMAGREQPALIIMDIQLPGMDGMAATRLLKSTDRTRHIKVLALTAMAMKGDEEMILASGCDGYLAKPARYKEFLETVDALMNNSR